VDAHACNFYNEVAKMLPTALVEIDCCSFVTSFVVEAKSVGKEAPTVANATVPTTDDA
jgi:hypothetical protein